MTASDPAETKDKERTEATPVEEAQQGPVSTDSVILATGGYDHTIKFWAASTGAATRTLQHPDSPVNSLAIAGDGSMIAAGGYQHIRMFDLTSNNLNPVVNYEGISKNIMTVGFQEDGRWMFTGGEDCSARIWDLKMRNLSCQKVYQANSPVNCVNLHPNQQELVIGDQSGIIHIWNLQTDQSEQLIPEPNISIQSISIDPQGLYMAAINNKGNCYVWALSGGGPKQSSQLHPKNKILAHKKYGLCCKFSPDSNYLVTSAADHKIKIWRTSDFSLVMELTCDCQRWVWDLEFTADSQYVMSASSDSVARLWSMKTGELRREYQAHQKSLTCLAFRDLNGVQHSVSSSEAFVGQFFKLAQCSLLETGPRVSTVKLMHTIQFYNNGSAFKMQTPPQHPAWRDFKVRRFSATTLATAEIEARVLNVCKAFDKITADKLTLDSHFINDLGLDSLDHVEVIMAVEDEFGFEVPDEHAEKLVTPALIAKYVADHQDS